MTEDGAGTKPRITDATVRRRTGKSWAQWFALLDRAEARTMTHTQIAARLAKTTPLSGWWTQMVTVSYEEARGLRQRHEKPDGYEISASRTLHVPASRAYRAWRDRRVRHRWMPDAPVVIRKAIPGRSLQLTWAEGSSGLDVTINAKTRTKCQVVVQHRRLADGRAAARLKSFWVKALDRLKETVEA